MAMGEGRPGCRAPTGTIVLLMALKSCSSRHLPLRFGITKMGVFHGDTEGSVCPACSCSCTNSIAADSFSLGRGHWSFQTGQSSFHVILSAWNAGGAMTLKKNLSYILVLFDRSWVVALWGGVVLDYLSPIRALEDSPERASVEPQPC